MKAFPLIALQELKNIGPKTTLKVADQVPCDQESFYSFVESRFKRKPPEITLAWNRAEQIVECCEQLEIHPIAVTDSKDYPKRLDNVKIGSDSPPVLYVRGSLGGLHDKPTVIAIIGTREPTNHGIEQAHQLGRIAAEHNVPVVSGLAYGCDYYGHEGCLAGNGIAIAVLAHGLDTVYPPEHEDLANRIVNSNGCLVSEYPPGRNPSKWTFIDRDRLQSALSDIVIVVQTGIKGGTMHTVGFAERQQRDIVCLVPNQTDRHHTKVRGNLALIRTKRGKGIESAREILSCLNDRSVGRTAPHDQSRQGTLGL